MSPAASAGPRWSWVLSEPRITQEALSRPIISAGRGKRASWSPSGLEVTAHGRRAGFRFEIGPNHIASCPVAPQGRERSSFNMFRAIPIPFRSPFKRSQLCYRKRLPPPSCVVRCLHSPPVVAPQGLLLCMLLPMRRSFPLLNLCPILCCLIPICRTSRTSPILQQSCSSPFVHGLLGSISHFLPS